MSPPHTNAAPRPLRVFVVENHDDSRLLLTMLLTQMGHEVHSAASMHEALGALPQARSEVLVSDIGLPDGNGWELLRRLQQPVYAIAMSGYGMNADRERSRAAGFRHHLVKPMDIEQLEGLLAEAARELDAAH
ncbi:MAG: response regulator [Rhizobacter sp.]|nr:response regulator [Rhizobacter sp.]